MALLEYVTKEAFAPFGTVIEHPDPSKGGFCVVEREENDPWRIGIYRYSNHSIQQFECHPYSKESFEPLKGRRLPCLSLRQANLPEKGSLASGTFLNRSSGGKDYRKPGGCSGILRS